jgi:K(+)-stimulated pyrophosphate-energized sodium pump
MCLSHYDESGKFVAPKTEKACCSEKEASEQVKVEITSTNGKAKATVITSENGKNDIQVFEGSLEEVKAKVEALK